MYSMHHIAISVSDIDRSVRFYSYFGFKEVKDYSDPTGIFRIKHLKNGGAFLEIFCYKDHNESPQSTKELSTDLPVIGVRHFGLEVDSLEQAKEVLVRDGLAAKETEIRIGKTGVRYFFIKDPDGILFEVLEDHREL